MEKLMLIGTKEDPFHLSLGIIAYNEQGKIAVVKTPEDYPTLPRKTAFLEEHYTETLERCAELELGYEIEYIRFVTGLLEDFTRDPETVIHKTTLYFEVRATKEHEAGKRDERVIEIVWITKEEALAMFEDVGNKEAEVLKPIIEQES